MTENKKQVLVTLSIDEEYKILFDKVKAKSGIPKSRMVRDMIDEKCLIFGIER